jgi:hypothetical protein
MLSLHIKSYTAILYFPHKRSNNTSKKSSIFWDITPCSPLKVNRSFGETRCLHLQERRTSQARNQHEAGGKHSLLHADFLLGLFFDPEDGGDVFLQHVG